MVTSNDSRDMPNYESQEINGVRQSQVSVSSDCKGHEKGVTMEEAMNDFAERASLNGTNLLAPSKTIEQINTVNTAFRISSLYTFGFYITRL